MPTEPEGYEPADELKPAERPPRWSPSTERAFQRSLDHGVPSDAMAVLARWWQVETWLRLLTYLELRAKFGVKWTSKIPGRSKVLAERDAENSYMPTADATNPLAYVEAGALLGMIDRPDVWELVGYALPKQTRWQGDIDELRSIRNRIAHLRRPHRDDILRIEQALRDMEPGARRALEAYNDQWPYPEDATDPVAKAWVLEEHPDARRLVGHAERSYSTSFRLSYSRRPWAYASNAGPIVGQAGHLIHATWYMRNGAMLAPRAFWEDSSLDHHGVRDLLVLVAHSHESEMSVSFSAVDDPTRIADAIGTCFDVAMRHWDRAPSTPRRRNWILNAQGLDWRVQVETPLVAAFKDQPFSLFGAD